MIWFAYEMVIAHFNYLEIADGISTPSKIKLANQKENPLFY